MVRQFLTRIFSFLVRYAAEPDDSEEWKFRKIIGVMAPTFGIGMYVGYGLLYTTFDERPAALVAWIGAAITGLGLLSYARFRHYEAHTVGTLAVLVTAIFLEDLFLGGFANSGALMIYLLMAPLMSPIILRPRYGLSWFLIITALIIFSSVLQPYLRPTNNLPPAIITTLYVSNILGIGIFILLSMYYYLWRNAILSHQVHSEHEKAESLLLNILPREIAAILKNENRVIADQFDGASILFADIVNFTPMSSRMAPAELVELLNDVFSYFDTLVEKYGLEKIKTIGDCYMAAAGVPRPRPDHAHALARLALEMRAYTDQQTFRGQRLSFRIGLNSGPVIAGVIGRKKFIYDLWGDVVNTASRMESHGAGGYIQITEATYELIKNDFVCEPRGAIQVKGKGEMNVWYVLDQKA